MEPSSHLECFKMSFTLTSPSNISFLFSFGFVILAIIFGFIKHKKGDFKILFYIVSAYYLGATVYPGISIIYFAFQKKTLMGESIEDYALYFGLSGILLLCLVVIGLYQMLFRKEKPVRTKK